MDANKKNADELSEKEIAERMERALKNIASTPPKPFTPKAKPTKRKRGADKAAPRPRHKK